MLNPRNHGLARDETTYLGPPPCEWEMGLLTVSEYEDLRIDCCFLLDLTDYKRV